MQLELTVNALLLKIGEHIEKTMQDEIEKMSSMIKNLLMEHSKALSPLGELAETVSALKQVVSDMSKSINEATMATSQINDTMLNYKQALLCTNPQAVQSQQAQTNAFPYLEETRLLACPQDMGSQEQTDLRILRDIDRKVRQVLIDSLDPDITGASQVEIKEKECSAIVKITNPTPPEDTTILEVIKLWKGGFIILFKDKEVVKWLQDLGAEFEFTTGLSRDAVIVQRSYSILVPCIPLTFDLTNEEHLREVKECNSIPAGTITKARWIKPVNRRLLGQRAAHAIFILKDITIANKFIRDGLKVCGLHIHPSRLKNEPMQCMKCRQWGHFAHACMASTDMCRTCREEHRTSECDSKEKTFWGSCKLNTHASWDRDCPEFCIRCEQYNENYPENSLPYFPSGEKWTQIPCPYKLQRPKKFPAKYAVATIQQPKSTD
jgi:hypothetical protein